MVSRPDFDRLVLDQLLPQFCAHYEYDVLGFKPDTLNRIREHDATWFLRALQTETVISEGAFFRSALSGAKEQIFWQGAKAILPRPIVMWAEPVITIAAAGRLHGEFGWPKESIGLQSKKKWAFDLVTYDSAGVPSLVCEVKKSHREIDDLIGTMFEYLSRPPLDEQPKQKKRSNAYRKVVALREMKPPLIWVLGPENYGKVFRVAWDRGPPRLEEVEESALTTARQGA